MSKLSFQDKNISTLDRVSLSRIGDAVRVEESVLSFQNISYHLLHRALVKLLLSRLWSKNLKNK